MDTKGGSGGGWGGGVMNWEIRIDMYTLMWIKQLTNKKKKKKKASNGDNDDNVFKKTLQ